ncbi:MAG TPA: phosphatidate cytidylyltransferase [Methylomusa anaerophila]|uniref:Phosphatidate cytidylyltransferase n=1 Tax=Methylomusa anaerophila TaxID=1930071 RepID=A0A348APZ9_9FIRM|nr:phosphatidate cytidylyltransferase [Methylomusa anaerophila]BBB93147.1 phosphatidate cytidylyltransferase [Methylomusa anaerophila]HML87020.1 phosphatidate cytidylyltransferase [Methylomusa anaerophila]
MLGKRILTAIVGIPIIIYAINYGQWVFAIAVMLLALIAWHEYSTMMKKKEINVGYYPGMIIIVFFVGCSWLGNADETILVIMLLIIYVLAGTVFSYSHFSIADAAFTVLGICYIGLTFAHLLMLRFTEQSQYINTNMGELSVGAIYVWLAFIGTWASDTFAFFIGSKLGRHRLCPAVSPGKTYEGVIGGFIGSLTGVLAFGSLAYLPYIHLVLIGLLIGIAAPLGDLVESALKRYAGVKDSGNILPGHGGILDRFDAMMITVPAVFYYINFFVLH